MVKIILYLIIGLFLSIESEGQITFASKYLENLFEILPSDCRYYPNDSLSRNTYALRTNRIINSHYVNLNYYLNGNRIEDIGIAIIDSTIRPLFESEDISRFIERKTLELLLIHDDNSLIQKLHENNLEILLNNNSVNSKKMLQKVYSIMNSKCDFKLKRDSLRYKISWNNVSDESVKFSFPATNTLVRGMDKKELDEEIIEQLENIHSDIEQVRKEKPLTNNILISDLIQNDSIYYLKNDSFVIKEINNSLYLKMQEGVLHYVFEPRYFEESICNLIQFPMLNDDLRANINHNIYGNEQVNYTMNFCDLMEYFKKYCTLYTGIEKKTENGLKTIVIILNNKLNVIHMMVIDVDKNTLFDRNKTITIGLRTNIPTNNIDNLFGEYIPQKTQYKVLIK
ncbi:MAG: hypothetical protein M0P61_05930 [Ignavibacteriaceae bacterium]|nr:hypothetical protein [Ignavibacteriaceae bacterium]